MLFVQDRLATMSLTELTINCQREIAYGLNQSPANDNIGGIIENNFIYRSGGQHGDVAIGVWNSPNSEVAYNTVILNAFTMFPRPLPSPSHTLQ